VARGGPNWWVVLAVSLALIAVLVATAGTTPRSLRPRALSATSASDARRGAAPAAGDRAVPTTTTTSTATSSPPADAAAPIGTSSSLFAATPSVGHAASSGAPSVTTTTVPVTTTTAPSQGSSQQPATSSRQYEGYLNPPLQTSQAFVFTGAGATDVSVVWSGTTYLTMVVSCPTGGQTVGGTSAMQATLPDAAGSCRATVSEPSSESTTLTFTITIGPPGG
jgi:hypothetical protein